MKTKTKGAFAQQPNGTWMIDTKIKINGKYKHFGKRGYPTLSAAKADFERAKEEFIKQQAPAYEIMFFEDLLEEYKKMRKVVVNNSTLGADKSIYNVYFLPYFKGKLIKDCLNKPVITVWYRNLVDDENISQNKKSKVITRMKDLLKFAYMHEFIDAPTYQSCDVSLYQVKYEKTPNEERVIWSQDEEIRFLEATKVDQVDYIMFKLFLVLGARIGEFSGLQGKCFDYLKNRIIIKQQINYSEDRKWYLTETLKTKESYRSVTIPSDVSHMLNQYIEDFGIGSDDFIFYGKNKKTPVARTTFRRKLYHYCEIANVRKVNPHAIRHQQAVKLARVCKTGEDLEVAAHRLGHSVSMFMDTYANHKDDDKQDALLSRLYS